MSYLCTRIVDSFPLEDHVWWGLRGEKSTQIGGVRSVERNMIRGHQTGSWWCKTGESAQPG